MRILKPRTDLPKHVEENLKDLYVRIGLPHLTTRLMHEVLSPREAELLEYKLLPENALPIDAARAILRVVARQRGLSLECALLVLSRELDLIGAGRYESMRRAIGESIDNGIKSVPNWDAASGTLRFNGDVVRQVHGRAKYIRILLDSFEEQHWQSRIDSPFQRAAQSRRLRDTVDSLKDGLRLITFRCDGFGGVEWLAVSQNRRSTGA